MSYKPGKYEARIVDYGFIAKEGKDECQVAILFEFDQKNADGEPESREITWFGYLTEKGKKWVFQTLVNCGFKGDDISALADGISSGLLDHETPVSIEIKSEMFEGKLRTKVAWVNRVGGAAFRNKMDKNAVKVKLGALNLKGEFAAYKKENNVPASNGRIGNFPPPAVEDDINFDFEPGSNG